MALDFFLFLLFSTLTFISALLVISSNNAVQSVLFLVFTFFNVACLLILLGAEFFSFLLIIVYVGAIAVLFLFVIMMLNIKIILNYNSLIFIFPISGIVLFYFFQIFEMLPYLDSLINNLNQQFLISWLDESTSTNNINVIGSYLYTKFALLFWMASLILLVAMIGAIVLTLHQKTNGKKQQINFQLVRNPKTTIKFLLFRK